MGLLHLRAITFLLVSFLLLTTCNKQVAAQEVRFFTGTWEEAKELAAHSNKPIFVKTYADWCMPCKQMEKYTFKDRDLANFYNNYFINLKINIESIEGKRFKEEFGVSVVPDLLFFDSTGDLVHREVGGRSIAKMKLVGRQVQLDVGNTSIGDTFANVSETPVSLPSKPRSRQGKTEATTTVYTYENKIETPAPTPQASLKIVDGIVVAPPPPSNLDDDQTSLTTMYDNRPVRRTLTGSSSDPIESIMVMKKADPSTEVSLNTTPSGVSTKSISIQDLPPPSQTVIVDGIVSAAPPPSGLADEVIVEVPSEMVTEVEVEALHAAVLTPISTTPVATPAPQIPTQATPKIDFKKQSSPTVPIQAMTASTTKMTYKLASYNPADHPRLYPQYEVSLTKLHEMYEAGEYRGSFLYEYAYRLKKHDLETTKIVNQYIQRQRSRGNLNKAKNMQFVYDFMGDYASNSLIILVNQLNDFHRIYGKDKITERFKQSIRLGVEEAGKQKDEGQLKRLIQLTEKAQLEDGEMFIFLIQSDFYERSLNWEKYAIVTRQYMRQYAGTDPQFLYRKAWNLMRASDKKKDILLAKEWLERSVELEDRFYNNEALTRMLYKLGKKKECRVVMAHALDLAEKEGENAARLLRMKEEMGNHRAHKEGNTERTEEITERK